MRTGYLLIRAGLLIPAALLMLAAMTPANSAHTDLPAAPLALATAGPGCTAGCVSCGSDEYAIIDLGAPNKYWAYTYGCVDVACPNGCQETLANGEPMTEASIVAQQVAAAIHAGDLDAVRALMRADERVEFNARRGVLQVIGCEDAVVATLGVSESAQQALLED